MDFACRHWLFCACVGLVAQAFAPPARAQNATPPRRPVSAGKADLQFLLQGNDVMVQTADGGAINVDLGGALQLLGDPGKPLTAEQRQRIQQELADGETAMRKANVPSLIRAINELNNDRNLLQDMKKTGDGLMLYQSKNELGATRATAMNEAVGAALQASVLNAAQAERDLYSSIEDCNQLRQNQKRYTGRTTGGRCEQLGLNMMTLGGVMESIAINNLVREGSQDQSVAAGQSGLNAARAKAGVGQAEFCRGEGKGTPACARFEAEGGGGANANAPGGEVPAGADPLEYAREKLASFGEGGSAPAPAAAPPEAVGPAVAAGPGQAGAPLDSVARGTGSSLSGAGPGSSKGLTGALAGAATKLASFAASNSKSFTRKKGGPGEDDDDEDEDPDWGIRRKKTLRGKPLGIFERARLVLHGVGGARQEWLARQEYVRKNLRNAGAGTTGIVGLPKSPAVAAPLSEKTASDIQRAPASLPSAPISPAAAVPAPSRAPATLPTPGLARPAASGAPANAVAPANAAAPRRPTLQEILDDEKDDGSDDDD